MFTNLTHMYKLSKTLKFELKPVGKTLEKIKESGVLNSDMARNGAYSRIKNVLDNEHKKLLERSLSNIEGIDWQSLANAYIKFRASDKNSDARKEMEDCTAEYRKIIAKAFTQDEMFGKLTEATPSKLLKGMVTEAKKTNKDVDAAVDIFASFACYLIGFQENRKNIYSPEKQVTSAANRAINENFPRFMECCTIFNHIAKEYPLIVTVVEDELSDYLNGRKLSDIFKIDNYSRYMSQKGIEDFNVILGGLTKEEGSLKLRGINEFINLERQKNDETRKDRLLAKMPVLYKQILSDRETISFVAESFERDADVLTAIKRFAKSITESHLIEKIETQVGVITASNGIYVDSQHLPDVSRWLCGNWSILEGELREYASTLYASISAEGKRNKEIERWMKRGEYTLEELAAAHGDDVAKCWKNDEAKKKFALVAEKYNSVENALACDEEKGLKERTGDVSVIKEYLDAVQDVLHFVKPLHVSQELPRDMGFYGEFDALYDELEQIVPLYNRVRNYITKKPSEIEKMKLKFDAPTLADGWDQNKELANRSMLLEKEGLYYLAIISSAKGMTKKMENFLSQKPKNEPVFHKMVYKYLPGPNKMLPKVFFSEKGKVMYKPSSELLENYNNKCHIKGPTFNLKFCHELIDFFKRSIDLHPDWNQFGFKFSPTHTYTGIHEFYKEVADQGYKVSFCDISESGMMQLVEDGSVFLFQLHNKDFSRESLGRPNLHTIYWRMLFAHENMQNIVLMLNGGAELFYRRAVITNPFVHKKGEKLVNRCDKDGCPIPEVVFGELFNYANGRVDLASLSEAAKKLIEDDKVVIKDVKHEITKDARYTQDKFFFHVPITLNAHAADRVPKFNDLVNAMVRESQGVNVIGIDRGERHLLYVTVVNPRGEILEQRSFNIMDKETYSGNVTKVNYHAKLDQAEKARDVARKSWATIGKIKDLKAGYLSVVVHEIATMMLKYNAVVALEDLNFGFKRGRFAIEKQVYQKFEKALIDKLNYLVFKDIEPQAPGGVLNAYQLTEKFESFEKLGKQTGCIYYVPAAYTSKIDPTTGFTNLFDMKKCTNAENIKSFFGLFDSIVYDESVDAFAFTFDYKKFKTRLTGSKTQWTVYSAESRLVYDKESMREKTIAPTHIIKEALKGRSVKIEDGFNLKQYIGGVEPSRENAAFLKSILYAFERTLQMRNSCAATGEDYIQSPVKNGEGEFFDSRLSDNNLPKDADANGAYHIALKGLWIVTEALHQDKPDLKLNHETWLTYAQMRNN